MKGTGRRRKKEIDEWDGREEGLKTKTGGGIKVIGGWKGGGIRVIGGTGGRRY